MKINFKIHLQAYTGIAFGIMAERFGDSSGIHIIVPFICISFTQPNNNYDYY